MKKIKPYGEVQQDIEDIKKVISLIVYWPDSLNVPTSYLKEIKSITDKWRLR